MSTLYVTGAQCIFAEFINEDDCEVFDEQSVGLESKAREFGLTVDRVSVSDGQSYAFLIANDTIPQAEAFYSGDMFEVDMTVTPSDTFAERAQQFTQYLNDQDGDFSGLSWSAPAVRYWATS